jgi:hypothetical protein
MELNDGARAPDTGVKKSAKIWWTMTDEVGPSTRHLFHLITAVPVRVLSGHAVIDLD